MRHRQGENPRQKVTERDTHTEAQHGKMGTEAEMTAGGHQMERRDPAQQRVKGMERWNLREEGEAEQRDERGGEGGLGTLREEGRQPSRRFQSSCEPGGAATVA